MDQLLVETSATSSSQLARMYTDASLMRSVGDIGVKNQGHGRIAQAAPYGP
ncbi:hypothetical protein [Micromonospora avicenniae]|uniref:Uncharacterized protein n=1 Tax=Micromonospora avicenniae TaxID=1198245 RepID=A0A1N6W2A5_9ACTN|nr:hypothetical protein [Micromonospora avicenniae]SIQ84122.1 hypothetical protein SAMN05444858_104332 [Micromonospora avicenniae]